MIIHIYHIFTTYLPYIYHIFTIYLYILYKYTHIYHSPPPLPPSPPLKTPEAEVSLTKIAVKGSLKADDQVATTDLDR